MIPFLLGAQLNRSSCWRRCCCSSCSCCRSSCRCSRSRRSRGKRRRSCRSRRKGSRCCRRSCWRRRERGRGCRCRCKRRCSRRRWSKRSCRGRARNSRRLVRAYSWRIKPRIAVEIVGNAGNGQTSAYAWTRRENVQVARDTIPVGTDVLRINRDAVGVLKTESLPI